MDFFNAPNLNSQLFFCWESTYMMSHFLSCLVSVARTCDPGLTHPLGTHQTWNQWLGRQRSWERGIFFFFWQLQPEECSISGKSSVLMMPALRSGIWHDWNVVLPMLVPWCGLGCGPAHAPPTPTLLLTFPEPISQKQPVTLLPTKWVFQ